LPELPKDPKTGQPLKFASYQKHGQEFYSDWVEVEGVFLRRYDYPSQFRTDKGEEVFAKSAVLFAKTLRQAPKPEMKNTRAGFITVVAVVGAVLVAIVLVAGFMSRKYGSGDLRMRMFALKREKAKAKGVNAFPAPSKPPLLGDEVPKAPEPVGVPPSEPPPASAPPKDSSPSV
jgi:hypothetical protein